jgi:hypothetical protein
MKSAAVVLLLAVCSIISGCGGDAPAREPSVAAKRNVAMRFAEAIFAGHADTAIGLLVHPDDATLDSRAELAAAPWRRHHGKVHLPALRHGDNWTFRFTGTHTHRDGRFERIRGDFAVLIATSPSGARVEYFAFLDETTRYSTHHDSVLLPSNR